MLKGNSMDTAPKLSRAVIETAQREGRCVLVQGAMGLHVSDGLAGKVASARSKRFLTAGTISAVVKSPETLVAQIRAAREAAPHGYIGVNLMAAINHDDFEALARAALGEGISFLVQGAGISREILRWCREAGTPFAGIVSSGRLAAMYERWGADFLVAEGSEAGGHLGNVDRPLRSLVEEVRAATSLPVIAAGGVDAADIGRYLAQGAAGVQVATRFIACSDGDAHPNFKEMHLRKGPDDVVVITSTVKGMKARAVRNPFTDALAAGKVFPPRDKSWFYGKAGYRGRKKACIECLAKDLCICRASDFKESFCITDALLRAVALGDMEKGLFYSGQGVTRIPERTVAELKTAHELIADMEEALSAWESANSPYPARASGMGA
jgi:nitronate monooxygenase